MTPHIDPSPALQITTSAASLKQWISINASQIGTALVISAILIAALYAARLIGRSMAKAPGAKGHWRGVLGRTLGGMRLWFMAALGLWVISVYADAPVQLAQPVRALFIIATGLQIAFILRELLLGTIEIRATAADPHGNLDSAMELIRLFVSCALFIIATILILANLGVDVTGLIAGLGIGGIAIGLAAQGIFSDLFAALSILFDKPFRRGDTVRWETTTGTVEAIGLKSTRIRSQTGEEIIVSNANLLSKELRNFTRLEKRRILQPLSLIYQTAPETCAALPGLLATIIDPIPDCHFVRCGLESFAASSLDFQLVYDVEAEDQELVLLRKHAVNLAILSLFAERGIAFAYPTQTTFTASPDGTMVMPYAAAPPAPVTKRKT